MTHPPPLSEMAPKLTEREIAVAALVGRRFTAKHIASVLVPPVTPRRVYYIITAIATKLGAECGVIDEREIVRDWWLAQVPIRTDAAA